MRSRHVQDEQPKANLDDILQPWAGPVEPDERVTNAIREAYRLGHAHGRHGIIRDDEATFIERFRDNAI